MYYTTKLAFAAALIATLGVGPARADAEKGRALAQSCQVCHGLDGVGTNPTIPNIGGQSVMYLTKQLQDFRDGRREDPQMSIVAKDLSDEDIRSLAEWYAGIKATYEVPAQ